MKSLLTFTLILFLAACSSNPKQVEQQSAEAPEQKQENVDPFIGFNKAMFSFNLKLDRWILKPVAKGYDKVAPQPVKTGVGNFFDNLSEVSNVVNDVLQWKWGQAGHDGSRFLINSTIGLLGIFDVAAKLGLEDTEGEDFGQTLAVWGVPQGKYIVLPVFGPSTFRDTAGTPVDWYTDPINYIEDSETQIGLNVARVIHNRAGLLDAEELAPKEFDLFYIFVRDAYLQDRKNAISDGEVVEDAFGDDFEELDDDDVF